jgi:hypothetical protein
MGIVTLIHFMFAKQYHVGLQIVIYCSRARISI